MATSPNVNVIPFREKTFGVTGVPPVFPDIRNGDFSKMWPHAVAAVFESAMDAHNAFVGVADIYERIKGTSDTLYVTANELDKKFTGQSLSLKELQTRVITELEGVGRAVKQLDTATAHIKRYQQDMTEIVASLDDALAESARQNSSDVNLASARLIGHGGVLDSVERRLLGTDGVTEKLSVATELIAERHRTSLAESSNQILKTFHRKLSGVDGVADKVGINLLKTAADIDSNLAETFRNANGAITRMTERAAAVETSIANLKSNLKFFAVTGFLLVAAGAVMGALLAGHLFK